MRTALLAACLVAVLAGCDAPSAPTADRASDGQPQFKASTYTDGFSIPIDLFAYVPCANNGEWEFLDLSGRLHIVEHVTINDAGHYTLKSHYQPMGIRGTGYPSGRKYQATGVTQDVTTWGRVGYRETYVNNFRLIGQGPGNNYLVHEVFHVTVNANGRVTVSLDHFRFECK